MIDCSTLSDRNVTVACLVLLNGIQNNRYHLSVLDERSLCKNRYSIHALAQRSIEERVSHLLACLLIAPSTRRMLPFACLLNALVEWYRHILRLIPRLGLHFFLTFRFWLVELLKWATTLRLLLVLLCRSMFVSGLAQIRWLLGRVAETTSSQAFFRWCNQLLLVGVQNKRTQPWKASLSMNNHYHLLARSTVPPKEPFRYACSWSTLPRRTDVMALVQHSLEENRCHPPVVCLNAL